MKLAPKVRYSLNVKSDTDLMGIMNCKTPSLCKL